MANLLPRTKPPAGARAVGGRATEHRRLCGTARSESATVQPGRPLAPRPTIRLTRSGRKIRAGRLNPDNNGRRQEGMTRPQLGRRRVKGRSRRKSGGGEESQPK